MFSPVGRSPFAPTPRLYAKTGNEFPLRGSGSPDGNCWAEDSRTLCSPSTLRKFPPGIAVSCAARAPPTGPARRRWRAGGSLGRLPVYPFSCPSARVRVFVPVRIRSSCPAPGCALVWWSDGNGRLIGGTKKTPPEASPARRSTIIMRSVF